jgi:hypothetical protein
MAESNGIPPSGSGRPRGRHSARIEALDVGECAAFRVGANSTIRALASYYSQNGRKYVTRLAKGGIIQVWRAA